MANNNNRPIYGQVVVGPPGSGKSTYCNGMQQYLRLLGRDVGVLNLDPANTCLPFETIFDIRTEIVDLASVMDEANLGPNGGLLFCMEYLEAHVDEIIAKVRTRLTSYIIFDFPGQVELYTHAPCVQRFLHRMVKVLDLRLTMVQLIDAYYCTDAQKFLSAALLGTTTMIRLELPAINVLSKVDLLTRYGELPMQLDYFTDCQDLDRLLPFLHQQQADFEPDGVDDSYLDDAEYQAALHKIKSSPRSRKRLRFHSAIANVIEDFGLLHFLPLDISNAESVGRVLAQVDKSNGYVFTQGSVNEDLFKSAITQNEMQYEVAAEVRERIGTPDEIAELQRRRKK